MFHNKYLKYKNKYLMLKGGSASATNITQTDVPLFNPSESKEDELPSATNIWSVPRPVPLFNQFGLNDSSHPPPEAIGADLLSMRDIIKNCMTSVKDYNLLMEEMFKCNKINVTMADHLYLDGAIDKTKLNDLTYEKAIDIFNKYIPKTRREFAPIEPNKSLEKDVSENGIISLLAQSIINCDDINMYVKALLYLVLNLRQCKCLLLRATNKYSNTVELYSDSYSIILHPKKSSSQALPSEIFVFDLNIIQYILLQLPLLHFVVPYNLSKDYDEFDLTKSIAKGYEFYKTLHSYFINPNVISGYDSRDSPRFFDLYNKYNSFFGWNNYIEIIQKEHIKCNMSRFNKDDGFLKSSNVENFNIINELDHAVLDHKYSHQYLDARHLITILTGSQSDSEYRSDIKKAFFEVIDKIKDKSTEIILQLFTRLKLARYELIKYETCEQYRNSEYDTALLKQNNLKNEYFTVTKKNIAEAFENTENIGKNVTGLATVLLSNLKEEPEEIRVIRYPNYDIYKVETVGQKEECKKEECEREQCAKEHFEKELLTYKSYIKGQPLITTTLKYKEPLSIELPDYIKNNAGEFMGVAMRGPFIKESEIYNVNIELVQNIYTYEDVPGAVNLWVDFGAPNFGENLFKGFIAQEEIMIWQAPYMIPLAKKDLTVRSKNPQQEKGVSRAFEGSPTPLIVVGANRHFSISNVGGIITEHPNIVKIEPPKPINVLAMSAPYSGGSIKDGGLSDHMLTIKDYFNTALAAFRLAKDAFFDNKIIIHTGAWGCGIFCGDIRVALFTQMFAAKLVGVDLYVYLYDRNVQKQQQFVKIFSYMKEYVDKNITYIQNSPLIFYIKQKLGDFKKDLDH